MARIFFDGYNLGLSRGTGVATYARVLARLTRAMGHQTGVVYALNRSLPKHNLEREVAFFDQGPEAKKPPTLRALEMMGKAGSLLTSGFGVTPQPVVRSGAVITRPFEATWVESDALYASNRLFDVARQSFAVSGRLLPVHFKERPDIFHWTYPLPMKATARANIYTVHDLVPVRLPYTTLDWKRYYIRSMRAILAKADHIVTVSENSKRDIVNLFGIEERRITNTFQAVDIPASVLDRGKDSIAGELGGIFGLDYGKYLLFYGSLEPKKNINRIVQAYLAANVPIPLVIVVAQKWQSEDETRLLDQILEEDKAYARSQDQRRIRRYEYLPFRLLMTLIQGASAVVFPSLYEGFGLPVLEAMTLGTPVITANTSSIPEVAGDACLTVDPYSIDAIRDAIIAVAHDSDLRADLSRKGLARAKLFSQDVYRERMAQLYQSLL